jgi:hypothetical protein
MKKLFGHIKILFALAVTIIGCKHPTENKALSGIKILPKFRLVSLDGARIVNSENISAGKPSVFFYFDPECDHCQKETKEIIEHRERLKKVRFYLFSSATIEEIQNFSKYYGLDTLTNFFVGRDYEYSFYNVFLPSTIPYMAVYDHRNNLSKIYNGEADISSLIKYASN